MLQRDLRREVGLFRVRDRRRRLPLGAHVGQPAGPRVSLEVPWPEALEADPGLCFDLTGGLIEAWRRAAGPPLAAVMWLTRPGVPEPHDLDLRWYAAAVRAFAAHEADLVAFLAVTRTGWWEVPTGQRRTWRRLRLAVVED